MSTTAMPVYEWKTLPWKTIERNVFKLQKRIYQASQRGDVKTVHRLQRLLMKSWSAKHLAVRRVTQDNQGKKTAGVDGVKSLTPPQRTRLAEVLGLQPKARPVRRVWIPKPGTQEKRGLGIPAMYDRASQALAKLALEPEWEARFEENSYGFRPGRSCHDAIEAIFNSIRYKAKYVLDADISKCFDQISHQALLQKLATFPKMRRNIKAWLEAGVMEGLELSATTKGTPQGGPLSPLLANVALHGLEEAITTAYPPRKQREAWTPTVIRYADDFVVLHADLEVIQEIRDMVAAWLAGMGLELSPKKTSITHTLQEYEGKTGLDFLGFTVRQFPVGKNRTGRNTKTKPLGFKTIIRPSDTKVKEHLQEIGRVIQHHQGATQAHLIGKLTPKMKGWAQYYSTVVSSKCVETLDHLVWVKLRSWALRRHPKKPVKWTIGKYWRREQGTWDFAVKDGAGLYSYGQTPIKRHVKVRSSKSVFDGDWLYWASRTGAHPEIPKSVAMLLKKQEGKCARCGLVLTTEDIWENDHIVPVISGGADDMKNRQLLHRHCHDSKTREDGSLLGGGTHDKS